MFPTFFDKLKSNAGLRFNLAASSLCFYLYNKGHGSRQSRHASGDGSVGSSNDGRLPRRSRDSSDGSVDPRWQ